MMQGPLHALIFVTVTIAANGAIYLAASERITAAIDTAILAVLVLLLDHLRERQRKTRASSSAGK